MRVVEYSKCGCVACAALARMLKPACRDLGIEYVSLDAEESERPIEQLPHTEIFGDNGELLDTLNGAFTRKRLEKIYSEYKEGKNAGLDNVS